MEVDLKPTRAHAVTKRGGQREPIEACCSDFHSSQSLLSQHQTLPPQLQPLEIQCFLLCPDKGHREAELEDASGDEREEHQTW